MKWFFCGKGFVVERGGGDKKKLFGELGFWGRGILRQGGFGARGF